MSKHEWGGDGDIERLVFWHPNSEKRTIYESTKIQPGQTVVYVEKYGSCFAAKISAIEPEEITENEEKNESWQIKLETPMTPDPSRNIIRCHIEEIAYGFDKSTRYELVIDEKGVNEFELVGDYETLEKEFKKDAALDEFMSNSAKVSI